MSEISLRANRLANEFEGFADAHDGNPTRSEQVYAIEQMDNGMPVRHEITTPKLRAAAQLLRERAEGVTVSDEQWRRIRQALGAMPYSGLASARHVEDVDGLVGWLHSMGAALRSVSERAQAAERELHSLQVQQRGMRAFLGLDRLDEIEASVDSLRVEQSGDLG
jgi:hypothetical protein